MLCDGYNLTPECHQPNEVVGQMNPVHNFPPYFSTIHSNIILPSKSTKE